MPRTEVYKRITEKAENWSQAVDLIADAAIRINGRYYIRRLDLGHILGYQQNGGIQYFLDTLGIPLTNPAALRMGEDQQARLILTCNSALICLIDLERILEKAVTQEKITKAGAEEIASKLNLLTQLIPDTEPPYSSSEVAAPELNKAEELLRQLAITNEALGVAGESWIPWLSLKSRLIGDVDDFTDNLFDEEAEEPLEFGRDFFSVRDGDKNVVLLPMQMALAIISRAQAAGLTIQSI